MAGGTKAEIIEKMGKDRELDVEFSEKDEDLGKFENGIRNIKGVHRCSVTMEDEKKVCKIFYAEEVKVLEDVIRLAADEGLTITNIRNMEPSLEEIFLTLTGKELRDGE